MEKAIKDYKVAWISGGCTVLVALIGLFKTGILVDNRNNLKISNSPGAVQVFGSLNYYSTSETSSNKNKGVLIASQAEPVDRNEFFNSDYGTLAILPNTKTRSAAINVNGFLILNRCSQYQFNKLRTPIWLQVNHYLPNTNSKRRHLGVFIVTFGRTGTVMPLEVYRNKKWIRPNSNKVLNEFSEVVNLPWSEYMGSINKWSSKNGKLSDSDRIVKGEWHAIPQGGKEFSWDYRKFWVSAASKCQETAKYVLGPDIDFSNVKVSTRLIGYCPVSRPASKSPVLFDIRTMDQENTAVFIAIYALEDSGQDTGGWYWIKRGD